MAGQHLKDLIVAYRDKDDLLFRRAAQSLILEEEAKKHTALARELRSMLAANAGGSSISLVEYPQVPEPPIDRDSSAPLAITSFPHKRFDDLVLSDSVERELGRLVEEVQHWPDLDAAGVPRRNRVLLYGPPGCGKTSTVEALASQLGRPLVTARVDGLISSYLGETATNIRKLFDYANSGAYVVLLDEFDSLGKLRDDPTDHGELRRVVNAVLQLIDTYRGPSIIVAATNHQDVLDSALWRRFDLVTELQLPTREQLQKVLFGLLRGRADMFGIDRLADRLVGLPHAAAEFLAYAALRRAVIEERREASQADLDEALGETVARRWL
jgi:SpoVK/Ycf46/Vps4 family AAA+-type ATPase